MTISTDALRFALRRTAAWRRSLSERYPSDKRNPNAAELLDQLAQTPESDIDPVLWTKFEPYLSKKTAREMISTSARAVGFSQRPKDLNGFIEAMLWDAGEQ